MKAYSTDLRERIVNAVKHEGNTPEQTASRYNVSRSTVYNYLQLNRDLHNLTPLKSTGRPRSISFEQEPTLRTQILENPDHTLEMHRDAWQRTTGARVSIAGMQRSIKRLGITLKKNTGRQRTR